VLELIKRKQAESGVIRQANSPAHEAEVINLMDALKASLAGLHAPPAPSKTTRKSAKVTPIKAPVQPAARGRKKA
jgi:non-homologous end joining protein Ku